jgi:hypothetical protein
VNKGINMTDKTLSRRSFIQSVAAALPVGALVMQNKAFAGELPQLDLNDPTAKALLYVHDAANVDTSNPAAAKFAAGQNCANCAQVQGEDGAEWRPCGIFPGKAVNAKGWCSVWVGKP